LRIERRLLAVLRPAGRDLSLTVALGLARALLTLAQAALLSRITTAIFLESRTAADVQGLLVAWLLLALVRLPLRILGSSRAQAAASTIKGTLRTRLNAALVRRGPQWLTGQRSGELLSSLSDGLDALDAYIGGYLPQVVLAALIPLLMLAFLAPVDPLSAGILLVTAPLIPVFMVLIGDAGERMTRRRWRSLGALSATLLDTLQGLTTLKLLGAAAEQRARLASAGETFRRSTMDVLRVTFLSALILEWVAMLGTAVVAVEIGLRLLYGRMAFEAAFFVLLLAPEFYQPLRTLGARFHAGMTGFEAARHVLDLADLPSRHPSAPAEAHFHSRIRFEAVSFRYPDRAQDALEQVDFDLAAGNSLAVLGRSGCGKSTLARLLLRFIQPDRGRILIDDQPLAAIEVDAWHAQIAWVPQQPHLFSSSALDNIRLSRPDASMQQVVQAARHAGLHRELLALPQGYDTPLGEHGARLSAGQARRLALARAFLKDAPLLILDEATGSLDALVELQVLESLQRLMRGRTTLIITHSLQAARLAERTLVLRTGRILEAGTPEELLARGGAYARLAAAAGGET